MSRGYIRQPAEDLTALMAALKEAMDRGDDPQVAALQAQIDQVRGIATQADEKAGNAEATGQNARQMVLNRDGRLTSLEDVAARFTELTARAGAEHSRLDKRIDDIELTPGPPGTDGKDGSPGRDGKDSTAIGAPGRDGADGQPGRDGTNGVDGLSAYQLARQNGYGGTMSQWLASLKGEPGQSIKGDPGTPADMSRVAALEAKVTSLENAKTFAVGIAQTPALTLLAQQDIFVELSREMPDTNYTIDLSRSQGLLSAGAVTFKAKTRSTVTYTIRAVVALGAGSLVLLARY